MNNNNNNNNNNKLRQEIIEFLSSDNAYMLNDNIIDTEYCSDQILKLIEKHGYRKVETMDGYWSD